MRLRVIVFTVVATAFVALATWATEPYNTSGRWACFSGTCIVGHARAPAIQLLTDSTGDAEIVLPNDSVGVAELATPAIASFSICGEATTINNNTVYYGPGGEDGSAIDLVANGFNGQACDINNAGSTTEANEDAAVFAGAVSVLGMVCRNEADANASISYTLRTAAGATSPSVTCTIADNARHCEADVQTTTNIAAGATVAIAAASSSDVGDNNGFACQVVVAF